MTDKLLEYVQIDMPSTEAIHMDMGYTDGVISGQGLLFEHWQAMPCPVGKDDPYDIRKAHADHAGCSNGNLYYFAGNMVCISTGISKDIRAMDVGVVVGSTMQITVPRFYEGNENKEAVPATSDRLYLKDDNSRVIATQLFEHNISGIDRVKYPIMKVELLIDSHGTRYYQGEHFDLDGGQIRWRGTAQPGMNPATGHGEVCSIRYQYRPYWYIERFLHDLRILRSGEDSVAAPKAALIQREYVYEDERNDPQAAPSPRQGAAPSHGSFGAR